MRSKTFFISIFALAVLFVISYSLYVTLKSGALENGVVTCLKKDDCFWTAHIHAFVPIEVCGLPLSFPRETGSLSVIHTHEEQNIIHWHDRLPYDNAKKALLNDKPLMLGESFDNIGIPLEAGKIFTFKNGNSCPNGAKGYWKMFVNGKKSTAFRDYIWNDRDIIFFIFDERSASEIEAWLKENPVTFGTLGRE